jgi:hypothetical protein
MTKEQDLIEENFNLNKVLLGILFFFIPILLGLIYSPLVLTSLLFCPISAYYLLSCRR